MILYKLQNSNFATVQRHGCDQFSKVVPLRVYYRRGDLQHRRLPPVDGRRVVKGGSGVWNFLVRGGGEGGVGEGGIKKRESERPKNKGKDTTFATAGDDPNTLDAAATRGRYPQRRMSGSHEESTLFLAFMLGPVKTRTHPSP